MLRETVGAAMQAPMTNPGDADFARTSVRNQTHRNRVGDV